MDNILLCTPQNWIEDEQNLVKQLEDHEVWDRIPLLNVNELHVFKDASLVRFRGMVQDMHNPEYYLEKFEIINLKTADRTVRSGKYYDAAVSNEDENVDFDSDKNITAERQTFVVTSVPGINGWVQEIEEEKYKIFLDFPSSIVNKQVKRSYEEIETEPTPKTSTDDLQKKMCMQSDNTEKKTQALSEEYMLNFPLADRISKKCHLKVYKDAGEIKLNDIYEFVGFLGIDSVTETTSQENNDSENDIEMEILHPPSSLIPRIHCVTYKKLKHSNPLLNTEDDKLNIDRINFVRKELLIVLTQLLLGDELAAEYLICHLISEVYLRSQMMPLGKFSLNISNVPKFEIVDFALELYKFIELFMPKSHYLPMTLANMNELSFIPKKDYECNRLTSGILQLSHNTHIVLDETKLSDGKLNSAGVNNVKAIASTIKNQRIMYDFNYYPLEFDCDIPFLILSEGKSMLNVDVHIVLKPEQICLNTFPEIIAAAKHFLKPKLLNDIRKYLTLARLTEFQISENMEELVQNEFVNMRQRGAITADDLHSLLVFARLLCISEGKTTLDEDSWKKACRLEEERKARINRYNKDTLKQNISVEQSASEDDIQNEEDNSNTSDTLPNIQRSTSVKNENDHETVSCYCSASHTDNFSTDEHDSLRDSHEVILVKGIQQSDSGADLTEYLRQDVEADWNKFWSVNGEKLIWHSWIQKYSAYINPDYLQQGQGSTREAEGGILSGTPDDGSIRSKHSSKPEKFLFDEKEVQSYSTELLSKEQQQHDKPSCSQRRDSDLRNRILVRNLSGSDEKLFTEVSEGWNPLSPLSIDCETEAERLLSSRCGSHASSSLRTVDSMTNVTRMTVSSIDLSNSTSSSDSFSSVSSVNSSLSSEESEEDYQNQWNILWKRHYEEEYLEQYNKFVELLVEGVAADSSEQTNFFNNQTNKTGLKKKSILTSNNKAPHLLGSLLGNLSVSDDKSDIQDDSSEADCEQDENVKNEFDDMIALGLPTYFGMQKLKKATENNGEKFKSLLGKSNSFESGRNRIKAAFNLLGIEFQECTSQAMTGQVDYKMKHIRLQNRHLKIRPDTKKPKHTYFDDDGNTQPEPENKDEETFHNVLSDSSDNKLSSCDEEIVMSEVVTPPKSEDKGDETSVPKRKKRKKKPSFPPEIKENIKLRKYWHKRFSLFSKFDQGIKLDEESWYSVTPEQVAKHAAERCRCDIIVDAFCGAGGNSIQFALTCKRVIAIDIDPKKISLAQNNAKVYGVADKIEFIVGDFFQLAGSLKADVVFLSPPWGGPTYLSQAVYELEEMLQPVPLSPLLVAARKISQNVAAFLPKNSNTYTLVNAAGIGGRVEVEQDFLNKKLVAVTAYYNDLIKEK